MFSLLEHKQAPFVPTGYLGWLFQATNRVAKGNFPNLLIVPIHVGNQFSFQYVCFPRPGVSSKELNLVSTTVPDQRSITEINTNQH